MPESQKRRLAAILFTDMVGYTDMMARDEQNANLLRKRQSQVLTDLHTKYEGEILQYFGDGTLSIFDSAVNAVRCATEIQLALQEEPRVPLRVGIHMGEVVWEEDGLYGHAVNIASRLESLAAPGSILVSSRIKEEVSNHPDIKFKQLGHFDLKNVPKPIELFSLDHPDLKVDIAIERQGKGQRVTSSAHETGSSEDNTISVAVLPFEDLSPEHDQDYLCDGIADEITTDLSGLSHLRVIARHSTMQLKGRKLDLRQIGDMLGVKYLLTGSVRKADRQLRVTAQLVQISENRQLWADKFRGTMEDIFDLQEEISKRIVDSLDLRLNKKEQKRIENRPIEDHRAYDAYLRARRESFKMTRESMKQAEELIEQAMDIIGPNALLLGTKGQIHLSYIMLGIHPDPIHLKIAEECLEELKAIDSTSQYLYLLRGLIRYKHTRIEEAAQDFREVLNIDPNNREGLLYLGIMLILAGRPEEAVELLDRLVEVDPLTAVNQIMPGYAKAAMGDLQGAVRYYERAYKMEPQNPMLILMMGIVPGRVMSPDKVIPVLQQLEPMAELNIFGRVGRFLRLALEGKKEEALEAGANTELQEEAKWDEHAAWWMAGTYGFLNQKEEALRWLTISVELGNFNYRFLAQYDPFLENLRDQHGFQELMSKVRQRWESFDPS